MSWFEARIGESFRQFLGDDIVAEFFIDYLI